MFSQSPHPSASPISFGARLAASAHFDALFRDGMALVEHTAAYLDGKGRDEARRLSRTAALAYASESMRLTTRLMQLASWLLLQRAVKDGEMTQAEALADRRALRPERQDTPNRIGLPASLEELIDRSFLLQERVTALDHLITSKDDPMGRSGTSPLQAQMRRLEAAFRR